MTGHVTKMKRAYVIQVCLLLAFDSVNNLRFVQGDILIQTK